MKKTKRMLALLLAGLLAVPQGMVYAEELADLEDRAPVIAYYVVRWFLLKKLVYVQYMVNKNIRSSIHDGDIHRQRNQARLNSDDIPFLSYRQMWMLGSGEEEAEEAAAE